MAPNQCVGTVECASQLGQDAIEEANSTTTVADPGGTTASTDPNATIDPSIVTVPGETVPATVPGAFIINGQDPATGGNTTFSFDIASSTWSLYPDLPVTIAMPYIIAVGGFIVQLSGSNFEDPRQICSISSSATAGGWRCVTVPSAVPQRVGHRFLPWGGIVYMFGGFDNFTSNVYNDVWAIDMDGVITNPSATQHADHTRSTPSC